MIRRSDCVSVLIFPREANFLLRFGSMFFRGVPFVPVLIFILSMPVFSDTLFLPGLLEVGVISVGKITGKAQLYAMVGLPVPVMGEVTMLPLSNPEASAQCASEWSDGARTESVKLYFSTETPIDDFDMPLAFVVRDQQSDTWLIGSSMPPFPSVRRVRDTGSPGSGKAGTSYEVTLETQRAMIRCLLA